MIAKLKAQCNPGEEVDETGVDAFLAREKANALAEAVAMLPQPETRERIETMYAFLQSATRNFKHCGMEMA